MAKKKACLIPGFATILAATDGSPASRQAVEEAIRIASVCSSKLTVLMVVEINADVEMWDASASEKIERDARSHLERIREQAEEAGVKCDPVLHFGDRPYRDIVSEAAKRRATVIVMGSHGRTGLARLMLGSVVTRVIGHAPCKVLVVPASRKRTSR